MRRIAAILHRDAGRWRRVTRASRAFAQSRPLVTEDPETVPVRTACCVEAGVDYAAGRVLSGVGSHAAISGASGRSGSASASARSPRSSSTAACAITCRSRSSMPGAAVDHARRSPATPRATSRTSTIGAKVRFMSETEGRPAMAVRFWTRLPNASNESGLGLDTTDFNFDVPSARPCSRSASSATSASASSAIRSAATARTTCSTTASRWRARCGRRRDRRRDERPAEHARRHAAAGHREPIDDARGGRFTHGPVRIDAGVDPRHHRRSTRRGDSRPG